jgi:hypothetical protein
MGVSSNFGNMFSVAGASLILPLLGYDFLPMLPIQILLNNLLYDISQSAITADNVDPEYVEKPKRWDISYIRSFMLSLGPVSSVFDFLTFFIMLLVFFPLFPNLPQARLFQTAWFIESLATQTFVIFAIRTRKSPFWKSKPGKLLVVSSIAIVAVAIAIPYTFLGAQYFGFVRPPLLFYPILIGLVGLYLMLAELVKRWFFKRNSYRVEQALVPKKRGLYFSRTARLVQDIVAVICLRAESEISIDSLLENLIASVSYPINPDEVVQNLHHLRRSGLISIDWHTRTIKRLGTIKDYVNKYVVTQSLWPTVQEDWLRINRSIQERYGTVNSEYAELVTKG